MEIRFGRLIVLACMGLAVACTSGTEGGTAGNTELNLDIVNPGGDTGAGFSIDRVDYRITCDGNPPGTYDIPPADTSGTDYNYYPHWTPCTKATTTPRKTPMHTNTQKSVL